MVNGAVIANFRRLANNHAHAVVNKQIIADFGAGVDFNTGKMAAELRNEPCQRKPAVTVKKMGRPVPEQGMKTSIKKNDFENAFGSRIFLSNIFGIRP